jgi:hypothetical protein
VTAWLLTPVARLPRFVWAIGVVIVLTVVTLSAAGVQIVAGPSYRCEDACALGRAARIGEQQVKR